MNASQRLLDLARQDAASLAAIQLATEVVPVAVAAVDQALAALQDDPADVGARIVRHMILRGTLENLTSAAITTYQEEQEKG